MVGCVIFWVGMLILGSLRESYSQAINDISECLAVLGTAIANGTDRTQGRSGRVRYTILGRTHGVSTKH
jgi:hypothetical protein